MYIPATARGNGLVKPAGELRLNRNHPAAYGLKHLFMCDETGMTDLVTGKRYKATGGSKAVDAFGIGWKSGGAGTCIVGPTGAEANKTGNADNGVSVIVSGKFSNSTSTAAIANSYYANQGGWVFKAAQYPNTNQVGFGSFGVGSDYTSGLTTPTAAGSVISVRVVAGTTQYRVKNSTASTANATPSNVGDYISVGAGFKFNSATPVDTLNSGDVVYWAAIFDETISAAQADAWHRGPFGSIVTQVLAVASVFLEDSGVPPAPATNTSDADQFILGSLGRYAKLGRGASGSRFVKQRPNDAGPVVWSDFFFDAAAAGHYTVNWESATYNITMAPVTLRRHLGMPVTPVSYAFSFQQVDLQVTRRLKVTPASYAFTFAPVTLRVHRRVSVTPASYVLTFPDVAVTRSTILHVSPTSYSFTFSPVTLDVIRRVNVDPATYTFTFAPVTLTYTPVSGSYLLNVDPTSYSFNFPGASVLASRKLPVAPTNYALTFSDVTMLASRKLPVSPAAFTLTFAPVTMIAHRKLPVIPATYVLSFSDAAATVGRKLVVTPATYTFTFADVTFVAPGAVFPPEAQVLLGVLYGPTGIEYTGEYADRIRYELSTGKFVKPIGDKLSLLL